MRVSLRKHKSHVVCCWRQVPGRDLSAKFQHRTRLYDADAGGPDAHPKPKRAAWALPGDRNTAAALDSSAAPAHDVPKALGLSVMCGGDDFHFEIVFCQAGVGSLSRGHKFRTRVNHAQEERRLLRQK